MRSYAIMDTENEVGAVISIHQDEIVNIQELDQFLDSYTGYTTGETKTLGAYCVEEIFPTGEI